MEKLGNYALISSIDEVSWGKLYRGFKVEGDKKTRVFVRVFSFELPQNLKFSNHLAVNDLVAIDYQESKGIYAEEYFAGATIHAVIKRCVAEQFPLSTEHALHILERILAGFEVHKFAFLHPHLTFLSYDGEVKGSAVPMGKILTQSQPESLYPYLSPQLIESKDWNPSDQVYAAGAFFFEMLTGKSLPASTVEEDRIAALTGTPAMEGEALPGDLQMIMLKALAQNPNERYQSLKEMREEMGKLIYDGTYAPTTFNVAFFMHTLFRDDINSEEKNISKEDSADIAALFAPPKPPEPSEPEIQEGRAAETPEIEPEKKRSPLPFVLVAVAAIILVVAGIFFNPFTSEPSPEPASQEAPISPELKKKLAEAEEQIERMEETRQQQDEELESLRKQKEVQKSKEIDRKLKEKEEEAKRTRDAIREMKKSVSSTPKAEPAKPDPTPVGTEKGSVPDKPEVKPETDPAPPAEETQPPVKESEPEVVEKSTPAPSVTKGELVDPAEVDQMPIPLKTTRAKYPPLAKRKRVQGKVILKVLVNENGKAVDFNAIRYPGGKLGLDKAAIKAVREWEFSPALKEGVPVKTWTVVTIPFTL